MGATGTGKTKLSIDISKVIGGEVINADKMQIYAGLDIATNKIRPNDQGGIPHHLIGLFHQLWMMCLYLPFDLLQQLLRSLLQGVVEFQFW